MPFMRQRRGISLTDIIVLVVLAALLIALWMRALSSGNSRRDRYMCLNNLHNFQSALLNYANMNGGKLPRVRYEAGAKPSVTGDGAAASNPFAADGPPVNNVPAALFLLLRTQDISPRWFICSGGSYAPDPVANPSARSNFTDVKKNLGYSFMYTYQERKGGAMPGLGHPILADLNPGTSGSGDNALIDNPNAPLAELRKGNSNNHSKRGQYVLYDNGSVEWHTTPFVGINNDNIYSTQKKTLIDTPVNEADALLLPTDD